MDKLLNKYKQLKKKKKSNKALKQKRKKEKSIHLSLNANLMILIIIFSINRFIASKESRLKKIDIRFKRDNRLEK